MNDSGNLIEFDFWGVYDPGVPNKERIVFRPVISIALARYEITLAITDSMGGTRQIFDHVFYFPDSIIEPPAWIFVYTCAGTSKVSAEINTQAPLHELFWGKSQTVFHNKDIVPIIVRRDGYLLPPTTPKFISPSEVVQKRFPLPLTPKK